MDLKTAGFGVAIVAASVGGSALVQSTNTLTVKAGATAADTAVLNVAQVDPVLKDKTCQKVWAYHRALDDMKAGWVCDGAWMGPSVQAELDKMAPDGIQITLTPKQDGENVTFDALVTNGELPEKPAAPRQIEP